MSIFSIEDNHYAADQCYPNVNIMTVKYDRKYLYSDS